MLHLLHHAPGVGEVQRIKGLREGDGRVARADPAHGGFQFAKQRVVQACGQLGPKAAELNGRVNNNGPARLLDRG